MDRATEMMLFARVVEEGSFSAAARTMDLTPSAVSKQIAKLEQRLGARLLNRTTRRLHLTEAGQHFYEYCARIGADIEAAEAEVSAYQQQVRGTLRLTGTIAFTRYHIVPLLGGFLAQHPQLNIQLQLTDRPVDLIGEGWDVGIRLSEQVKDPSLVARRLAVNSRIICAAPSYLARHGVPKTPKDLLDHNCLTVYTVSRFNDWEFDNAEGSEVLHVRGNLEMNTADALLEAMLSGAGLARVSAWLATPYLRDGRLVQVLPDYAHERSAFYVMYPSRQHLSSKVRTFVDHVVDAFSPTPPWEREEARPVESG